MRSKASRILTLALFSGSSINLMSGVNDTKDKVMLDDVGMSPFLRRVTIFASGGPFLDGYVLAIIGVALVQLTPQLQMTAQETALTGVAALAGLFLGTLVGGYITDLLGRKVMFTIDIAAIAAISIVSIFVSSPVELIIMRLLIGVAIGADYPIATSLVAEFTPGRYRAISMGVLAAMWYVGATFAGLVGFLCINLDDGWKWMLGSSILPCLLIFLGRLDIPESPRWLNRKGRTEEATMIVHRLFGMQVELEKEAAQKTRYRKLFTHGYFGRVIFVGTIWLCQVVPMFAIYTFGPQIMEAFGLSSGHEAILGDIAISLFFLAGCIPAMYLLNSLGRRPMLIGSFAMMTLTLLVLGIYPDAGIVIVVSLFALYAFFSGGPGIMQWLYPNELFPTDIRASAVGAAMAFSRIGTVVSTYALPMFMVTYGVGSVMLVGAGISVVGLLVSIFFAPETKGRSLVQTSALDDGKH
ncbi:MAG: MFS transporter [Coriobacteriales bacterium]|nr:MFS transporter [Coriobacteriales bacterium]